VADFDPNTPSIARVYDYILGGKDNFASDREVAAQLIAWYPVLPELGRENRLFLSRAVTWAANQGISQFVDLGCGMPTEPNTDDSAAEIIPDARVVYVDKDPVVITHLRERLAKGKRGVTVVDADTSDVTTILGEVRAAVDLSAPVCLLMGALLHFYSPQAARDLVTSYVSALGPGSCLVLSIGRGDGEQSERAWGTYSAGVASSYNHSVEDFTSFFGSLELVPPGVVDARAWRPGWEQTIPLVPRDGQALVGVARVA
jgi:hypothetical protein